jgi:hypothetical protein
LNTARSTDKQGNTGAGKATSMYKALIITLHKNGDNDHVSDKIIYQKIIQHTNNTAGEIEEEM